MGIQEMEIQGLGGEGNLVLPLVSLFLYLVGLKNAGALGSPEGPNSRVGGPGYC